METAIRKKLIIGLAVGFLVYVIFVFFADLTSLVDAGREFPWELFPVLLLLATGNYIIRLFRWKYFLKRIHVELPKSGSTIVFFAGLAMSITPGKFGELFKAQYVKNMSGINRRRTAPVVIAERLTDLIGVLMLASFGVFVFSYGRVIFIIVLALILGFLITISSRRLSLGLLRLACVLPPIRKRSHKLEEAYENITELIKPVSLFLATALSVLAWGLEGYGFYLAINAFPGMEIGLESSFFIYAFSILVGAVTMLPGGLGATEGTMAGLLVLLKVPVAIAIATTLIIRMATLWFAVAIGLLTMVIWRRVLDGKTGKS